MTLQPLLQSGWAIQVHVAALVLAFLVGTWQFVVIRRGSPAHRVFGQVFVALMVVMALVALFIHEQAPHGPFHGLSVMHLYVPLILLFSALAIIGARAHWLALHRFAIISLYFGSLVFTGLVQIFLAPGLTHQMLFGRH